MKNGYWAVLASFLFITSLPCSVMADGNLISKEHQHLFDPNCPTCQYEEKRGFKTPLLPNNGVRAVLVSDVLKGGGGTMVSVPRDNDYLRDKPDEQDLQRAINGKQLAEAQADLELRNNELNMLRIQKENAEKRLHNLSHERELLQNEEEIIRMKKLEKRPIVGKETIGVLAFPGEDIPMAHHVKLMMHGIQEIRDEDRKKIEDAQSVAQLHDITDNLSFANPGISDPSNYKNLILPVHPELGEFKLPVDAHKGTFFINPKPKALSVESSMLHSNPYGVYHDDPDSKYHFDPHAYVNLDRTNFID